MKTEKELNEEILKITMTIQEKYPELSEYLGELPVTIPNAQHPEINLQQLTAYYDSLTSLLENYVREHTDEGAK